MKETAAAIILINKSKEILLLRYAKHDQTHWDFPKGRSELHETPKETAVRELLEETGISIERSNLKKIGQERYTYRKSSGESCEKEVIYFLQKISKTPEVTISEEHNAYKWVNLEDAKKLLHFENQIRILEKIKESI